MCQVSLSRGYDELDRLFSELGQSGYGKLDVGVRRLHVEAQADAHVVVTHLATEYFGWRSCRDEVRSEGMSQHVRSKFELGTSACPSDADVHSVRCSVEVMVAIALSKPVR